MELVTGLFQIPPAAILIFLGLGSNYCMKALYMFSPNPRVCCALVSSSKVWSVVVSAKKQVNKLRCGFHYQDNEFEKQKTRDFWSMPAWRWVVTIEHRFWCESHRYIQFETVNSQVIRSTQIHLYINSHIFKNLRKCLSSWKNPW